MLEIRTFDSLSKQSYVFYLDEEILVRLRCCDYVTGKDVFYEYGEGIVEQHFKRAIHVACKDEDFNYYQQLLQGMRGDAFHSHKAKEIIARQICKMSNQVKRMSEAMYRLYY